MESARNKASRERVMARFEIGEHLLAVVWRPDVGEPQSSGRELARFVINGSVYALIHGELDEAASKPALSPAQVLTARELQIAALVSRGLLNKEVADRLRISEWTVCAHLRRIYSKLGVSTRAAMVFQCASLVRQNASE